MRALRIAWTLRRGDSAIKDAALKHASFEDTPVMAGGRVHVCSPFNEVFALDPATGRPLWRFGRTAAPPSRSTQDCAL
ncbi:MAG TPA: hypothetical protein VH353_09765 [Caulobacteraceae bacterium]|nr:hypothetical protein [Caulobacteraceae bacterium]